MRLSHAGRQVSPDRTAASQLRRCTGGLVVALALSMAIAGPVLAANNPGTGDTGFFTFVGGSSDGTVRVNVASGDLYIATTDLPDSEANYHVVMSRHYNSLASTMIGILGPRWTFSIDPQIKVTSTSTTATLFGPSGYEITFQRQADGSYQGPAGFNGTLTKTSGGWRLSRAAPSHSLTFASSGALTATTDPAGREFTVAYTSAAGKTVLSSYGTSSGRRANLSYTGDSLVRELDDPASGHHYYAYTSGRLTRYEAPSSAQTIYAYDSGGRLNRVAQPGGEVITTTNLTDRRVSTLTVTPAIGTAQTHSYDYSKPSQTTVTKPDGTRRTYVYDDDYRVTRDYDPDATPTIVASGEWWDAQGDYVAGNRAYDVTLSASSPDGAGIARVSLEEVGVGQVAAAEAPCTSGPEGRRCPRDFAMSFQVDAASLAEGSHTYRALTEDEAGHAGSSDTWTVFVDRSAPDFDSDFVITANLESSTNTAIVDWSAAGDALLADGTAGAGVAETYRYRYRRGTGDYSEWSNTALERAELPESFYGEVLTFEIAPGDDVDNYGPIKSATATVSGEGEHCQATASGVPGDCSDEPDDPLDTGEPLADDFGPDAEELDDEEPVDLVPVASGGSERAQARNSVDAYRVSIRIQRQYEGEPGRNLWGTIRRYNNSFVIGNANDGWTFDLARGDYTQFGWRAGRIYGGFGTCGWIRSGRVPTSGEETRTACSKDFRPNRERFADGLNCQPRRSEGPNGEPRIGDCNRATLIELKRNVTDVDFCLNVDPPPVDNVPVRCENKAETRLTPERIRNGYKVSWRYVTNGQPGRKGKYVLVEDSRHVEDPRHGRWGFIPRRAFREHLCTRTSTSKYNCGAPDE
jgi:YD repeat-containing protein